MVELARGQGSLTTFLVKEPYNLLGCVNPDYKYWSLFLADKDKKVIFSTLVCDGVRYTYINRQWGHCHWRA